MSALGWALVGVVTLVVLGVVGLCVWAWLWDKESKGWHA